VSPSHPPSLRTLVERTLRNRCSLPHESKLAVAVSGGGDSMALLHILSGLRESRKLHLLVLSVNHGLRPDAQSELDLVEGFCRGEGLEFRGLKLGLSGGSNLQERARVARYEILWRQTHERFGEDAFLVTAHHKEDRAETVLLRLLRGTSLEGLNVLPPRSGALLRPMIEAARSDVEAHLKRHNLPFCRDPSNLDQRFLRVRVRTELIPLLQNLSPGAVEHLVNLAEEAAGLDEPLGLNREQRNQIRRALRDGSVRVDLPLPSGLRLFRDKTKNSPE
jgi:tRNA(Ile)-lysidine synthase